MKNQTISQILNLKKLNNKDTIFSDKKYSEAREIDIHLQKHLNNLNYEKMTKIQKESYDTVYDGQDCIIKSQTGSGKTLAYLVPLLNFLIKKEEKVSRKDGCYILILTPTRELSLQINKILEKVTKGCIYIVPGVIVGGQDTKKEKQRIRKGLNIIAGTPGRILYHLNNSQNFDMRKLQTIVFEEADNILDMGFSNEIDQILEKVNEMSYNYQNILVSASITDKLESLLGNILKYKEEDVTQKQLLDNFKLVGFGDNIKKFIVPKQLNHFYIILEERNKLTFFLTFLKLIEGLKTIVFVSTADQANYLQKLCNDFKEMNYKFDKQRSQEKFYKMDVWKIHGHMEQKDRSRVFMDFNDAKKGVMFCTNVASRGLDFASLELIVLFDVSPSYKDYINRVGRTARIEEIGSAVSLLYEQEGNYALKLTKNCNAKQLFPHQLETLYKNTYLKDVDVKNFGQFFDLQVKYLVEQEQELRWLSRRAFNSFCRAYSLLKDEESFQLKRLNLHRISKSYGLVKSTSKNKITKDQMNKMHDTKKLSNKEISYLGMKKRKTEEGLQLVKSSNFMNAEFDNQFQQMKCFQFFYFGKCEENCQLNHLPFKSEFELQKFYQQNYKEIVIDLDKPKNTDLLLKNYIVQQLSKNKKRIKNNQNIFKEVKEIQQTGIQNYYKNQELKLFNKIKNFQINQFILLDY